MRSYAVPRKESIFGRDGFGHMLSHEIKHLGRDGFGHMLSHKKKTFSVGRIRSYAVTRKENILGRDRFGHILSHEKKIFSVGTDSAPKPSLHKTAFSEPGYFSCF